MCGREAAKEREEILFCSSLRSPSLPYKSAEGAATPRCIHFSLQLVPKQRLDVERSSSRSLYFFLALSSSLPLFLLSSLFFSSFVVLFLFFSLPPFCFSISPSRNNVQHHRIRTNDHRRRHCTRPS